MSELWLERLTVQDYRSLGHLEVTFPRSGLVILAGPNGLGKSSVFEAVEWALTGDSARRMAFVADGRDKREYFARQRADGTAASRYVVDLRFQGVAGPVHIRREGGVKSATPKQEAIFQALVRPGWDVGSLEKLRNYLHLTHLLPQSRVLQPIFHTVQDQWSAAEGLFRLASLESANGHLRRVQRSNSILNKQIDVLGGLARSARDTATAWSAAEQGMADRANLAPNRSSHSDDALRSLGRDVAQALGIAEEGVAEGDLAGMVVRLQGALTDRRTALAGRRETLAAQVRAAERYAALDEERASAESVVAAAVVDLSQAEQQEAGAAAALAALLTELVGLDAALQTAKRELATAEETLRAVGVLERLDVGLTALRVLSAKLPGFTQSQLPSPAEVWTSDTLTALADHMTALEETAGRTLGDGRLRAVEERELSARVRLAELVELRNVTFAERARLHGQLAARRQMASRAVELVSELIAQLASDASDCPLCGTRFPHDREPHALLEVARSRLGVSDGALDSLDGEVRALSVQLEKLEEARVQAESEANAASVEASSARRVLEQTSLALVRAAGVPSATDWAMLRLGGAETWSLRTISAERDRRRSVAIDFQSELDALVLRRPPLDTALQASTAKRGVCVGRIDALLKAAESRVLPLETLQTAWTRVGLPGRPAVTTLSEAVATNAEDLTAVAAGSVVAEKVDLIVSSVAAAEAARGLERDRAAFVEAAAQHRCAPEDLVAVCRGLAEKAEAKAAHGVARRADLALLQERLDVAAAGYRTEVFAPLEPAMRAWLTSLLADRSWEAIDQATDRGGRSGIELMYRLLGTDGKAKGEDRPARQMLSEGQLAAVAVARMLTWNGAFPWSFWSALLLDDPLQYSDTLHVSGLADTLRGLLEANRMQIILSTHDVDLARYFERKFRARGIEVGGICFEAPGPGGAVWSLL
jgi:energy-coupling factor transporter ATP-binding protein EcfA2